MITLSFELENGRKIFLRRFADANSYEGLMEGKISAPINEAILKNDARSLAKAISPHAPHLVLGLSHYRSCIKETLPSIMCAGEFVSYVPAKDPERHASSIAIVWFQNEMFPLFGPSNAAWIKEIVWEDVAADFDW